MLYATAKKVYKKPQTIRARSFKTEDIHFKHEPESTLIHQNMIYQDSSFIEVHWYIRKGFLMLVLEPLL